MNNCLNLKCDSLKLKDVLFTAIDTGTSGLLDPELRKLPLVTNKVAVSSMPSQKKIRLQICIIISDKCKYSHRIILSLCQKFTDYFLNKMNYLEGIHMYDDIGLKDIYTSRSTEAHRGQDDIHQNSYIRRSRSDKLVIVISNE